MKDSFENIAITSFPDIMKIDFKSIDKKYLKVLVIHVFLIFLIAFSALSISIYNGFFVLLENIMWPYLVLFLLFITLLLIRSVGFKKRKYAIREKDISFKKGIFFRSLTTVPFNRIQHIEIDQGPVSRFFGLVSLMVFTAGDSSDDLKISGLLKEDAQQIKEFISNKIDG